MIPLNAMAAAWTVLVPLAQDIPDPDDVKPGWIGFVVVVLLSAAVVFLLFSLRKQLRKVDFDEPGEDASADENNGAEKNGGAGAPRTP